MVIDAHVHIWENTGDPVARGDGSLTSLLKNLEANPDIQKAVILPIAPKVSNRFVGEACKAHPDKLIGFASVDPHAKNATKILERDVREYGLKGLKIHPRIQKAAPSSPEVVRLVQKAAKLGLPVLVDCFPQRTAAFPVEKTYPDEIYKLAMKVPEAKIIMAHLGGYKLWDAFAVARACPNMYFDLSFTPYFFRNTSISHDLAFVLKKLGARRCIYGSDYPEAPLGESLAIGEELAVNAGLSEEDKEYFFGKSLLSILPV